MKIKVGDTVYDGNEEPVMVILTDQDKENIENMHSHCDRYCVYPRKEITIDEIKQWMNEV